jgi:tetratricopeptide (TPR) repeat protein
MHKQPKPETEKGHAPDLSVVLGMISIVCIAVHFCFLFLFPHIFKIPALFGRTWGFHFITYFSVPVQVVFYILAVAVCVPFIARHIARQSHRLIPEKVKTYLSPRKETLFVSISVLSIPVFWLLRSKYAFLGDNFGIVERVVNNTFMPDECGAIFVLHCFYKVMHALFSLDGIGSIKIFSYLCGGVFVYLSLRIAGELGATFFEKVSLFLFYVSFCTIQHFCGYVEVYAGTVVLVLLYLYTSILCLRGKVRFAVPVVCLAAAIIMHLECLMLSPAILYVLYETKLKKQAFFRQPGTWATAVICGSVLAFYPVYKLVVPHLMPLTSTTEMTLFSFTHAWEFLNGQLLGCGPGLFILAGCLVYAIAKRSAFTPEIRFLLASSVCILAGLFVYRSSLGSADWDIFSYSSLAVNLLSVCLFFHLFGNKRQSNASFTRYATAVFIGLMILHSAPWILINAGDRSARRFEDIIKTDPAYGWIDYPTPDFFRPRICRIAMRMMQNGLTSESCDLYKRAFETDPDMELNLYNYYIILCQQKQTAHASVIVDSLAQTHPESFLARSGSILKTALSSGDTSLSMNILHKYYTRYQESGAIVRSIFPQKQSIENFQVYVEMLLKKKNLSLAQQVCTTMIALEPKNGINHYDLAQVFFEKGEYDSVIAICSMLNREFPEMPYPVILGSQAFRRKQGIPDDSAAPNLPGVVPEKQPAMTVVPENEMMPDVVSHYEDLLRKNPNNIDAHNNLGVMLAEKGQTEEAIGQYREALRLKPDDEKVHFNLGNVFAGQNRFEDAIAQYKEAVRINPRFAEAHNNLGNVLAQARRIDEAIVHFNEAININPQFTEAQANLDHARRIKQTR